MFTNDVGTWNDEYTVWRDAAHSGIRLHFAEHADKTDTMPQITLEHKETKEESNIISNVDVVEDKCKNPQEVNKSQNVVNIVKVVDNAQNNTEESKDDNIIKKWLTEQKMPQIDDKPLKVITDSLFSVWDGSNGNALDAVIKALESLQRVANWQKMNIWDVAANTFEVPSIDPDIRAAAEITLQIFASQNQTSKVS